MLTVPRLIGTSIWIACGVMSSFLLGHVFGAFGYVLGFLVAVVAGFLLTWLVLVTLNVWLNSRPDCRRGKCRTFRDYVWKRGTVYGRERDGTFRYRCRCGDEYVRDGRRLLELLKDGTTRPYKRYKGRGRWVSDTIR